MMRKCFFVSVCLFFAQALFAQASFFDNYVYQMWSSFGGLTGTTATDIVQTKDGYINVGTYEGLVRFDGVAFNTIKRSRDNDYHFASVRAIYEDSRGTVWLGSNDEGLQKIAPDGNKSYTTQNGLPNNSVRALVEDKNGNIWIGTAAGVVYLTPQGHLITPQFQAGTVSKGIIATSLYCDTAGRVWLVTANEKGLFLFADGLFRTMPELDRFGNYFCTSIAQDLKGDFWIGLGGQGLVRVRNSNVSPLKTGTMLDTTSTSTIYVATDGTIWFGTEKGLAVFSNGAFFEYQVGKDLSSANINKIICDREGNIWFATDRNGIGKLTHGKFKVTKLGATANAIVEDARGRIWVGTDSGVFCYDDERQVHNQLTEYTKGLRVRHVGTTANGDILVSCYTKPGQLRYNPATGAIKSWTTDNGLVGNKVRVAIETAPNELYVGTTTGLSIIHADGSINNFKQIDGLVNEYIMCLYKDNNDIVWIGTDGDGIYLIKDERILSHITTENGLAGNVIFKINQVVDGAYWICSGSGITRCSGFDPERGIPSIFESVSSENGLGTDSVFQILADGTNNLWIISNHGIASASSKEILNALEGKATAVTVKSYSKNDGLDSDGPTSTAKSLTDRHGRLWFTMVDGVAVYDPVRVYENPVMPLVHIESVTVDNKLYTNTTKPITLKPGTKRVEIKFTGISFDAPERIRFTHKLTNFEDDFSAPSSVRALSYTNLKPGRHTFLVNAINGDGFYSEQAEAMLFVQKPYLYQMPVFWIVLVILILGSVIVIFYLKQRAIQLENLRLENMVQQRTAELAQEKDKSDHLLRAILPDSIANELKEGIHSIGKNHDDVTILFSDIVDFTKTSGGYSAAEIVDALNNLFDRFDDRARAIGVEKIKTIGDAYMAACGIPDPVEDHAERMAQFAKGMYEDLAEYNKTARIKFNIRIGLNCGPVTAGILGKTKFIYDVWGNTVNVASRMESAAQPGKIRVSQSVYDKLKDKGVEFSEPIQSNVKGKGLMTTYDLL